MVKIINRNRVWQIDLLSDYQLIENTHAFLNVYLNLCWLHVDSLRMAYFI